MASSQTARHYDVSAEQCAVAALDKGKNMTKDELADQLRTRVIARNVFSRAERRRIMRLPADEIIDAYITCSDCGHKQVEGVVLASTIERAHSATEFIAALDARALN